MRDASDYRCSRCGASGCKLWRDYSTFLNHLELYCAPCAARDQGKDVSDIDAGGRRASDLGDRTDQIGCLVPAVPTEDGSTFWGYTAVPDDRVRWWRALPTLPPPPVGYTDSGPAPEAER
jgi:hypothetical protein